jgi:hypothetical protein
MMGFYLYSLSLSLWKKSITYHLLMHLNYLQELMYSTNLKP